MSRILSVRGALPAHRHRQREITEAVVAAVTGPGRAERKLRSLHGNCGVDQRHLVLPVDAYGQLADFDQANDLFLRHALDLGARAVEDALKAADLTPSDVDLVISTTVTGLAVPSLDARIAAAIGLRPDVKRLPLFGLGCVAGAAGVARMHDYLVGHPHHVAVLVAVELCSLTVQRDDLSTPNLVASGLFGDGAAAVVAVGRDRAAPHPQPTIDVLDSRSHLYPDSERIMGFDIGSSGLRIVLDPRVPDLVHRYLRDDVDLFLADNGLQRDDIGFWVCHPGGPKVIDAVRDSLGLTENDVALTRSSLARIGNLSSASVLHVLFDTLRERPPSLGTTGLLLAMGPGFCSELVLLRVPTPMTAEVAA